MEGKYYGAKMAKQPEKGASRNQMDMRIPTKTPRCSYDNSADGKGSSARGTAKGK